jgi:peptidyl-prolyl cis-trans isomerase SurA
LTLKSLRKQFERQFIQQQYLLFLIQPKLDRIGREQIVEYYQKHPEEFEVIDGVQWQDIFIAVANYPGREAARKFAEQIEARVRAGEDVAQLATQYDNGYSSYNGGQGSGSRRGQIQPREAEPYLFQMRDGDVALIELGNGFHVIRLVKREYAGTRPFDEQTQTAIRDKLRNEVFARESKRIIADLRSKATIEIANPAP